MGTHKIFCTRYFDVNKQNYEIFQTIFFVYQKVFLYKNLDFANPIR